MTDAAHMRAALGLARRGLGQVWPNPSVGCVVVAADGRVIGRGVTAPGGRPHAEFLALQRVDARGATVFVTLEPCARPGRGPACAEVIIGAGVARVVVATGDPDPRVDGQGVAALRAAGIAVEEGVLEPEARDVNAGFFARLGGTPLVTLKVAATLDGRIATRTGESQWITGEAARRVSQALRATQDAILVGVNTVLADDPRLTCRLPGARTRPLVRVVLDSRLRLPLTSRLAATLAEAPLWVVCADDAEAARRGALEALGAEVIGVAAGAAGVDLAAALGALAARGITRLLVEGGAQVAAGLLRADLVDRMAWFAAPAVMGADGVGAAAAMGLAGLGGMPRFVVDGMERVGADTLTQLRRA